MITGAKLSHTLHLKKTFHEMPQNYTLSLHRILLKLLSVIRLIIFFC